MATPVPSRPSRKLTLYRGFIGFNTMEIGFSALR